MVPGMSITDTKHYFCPKGSPNSLWNNFESISDPNLEYTTKNLKFPRVKIGIHEIALYYGDFDQKWKPEKWWKKLVCNKWCRICIYPTYNTFFVQRGPQTLSEKNLSRFKGHFSLPSYSSSYDRLVYIDTSPRGAASGPLAEPLCSENGSDWKSEYLISKIVMICDSNHLVWALRALPPVARGALI